MTLATAPNRHLSTEPPQNKEEAVFMFEVGEECQRRALRFLVEIEGMSYGEIVKLAQDANPNSRITKGRLKYLSEKMKADGEPLKTKIPQNFLKAKRRPVENSTETVENSEPEIELVTVTVEDPPTPAPTPTPSAPQPAPASIPEPAPSVPSAGSSEPFQWTDHPRLKGWNGSLNERGQKIYNREVRSSRSRVRMAEQLAEFKVEIEKSMKAASNNHSNGGGWALLEADVAMVEATLQREKRPGIKETLEAVMHEAERIQKYASETLRVLQLTGA